MNRYHRCACRIVKTWQNSDSPHRLVVIAPNAGAHDVRNAVAMVSRPGEMAGEVRTFADVPPADDFYLAVCNGGSPPSGDDVEKVALWRKAARKCGLFL